MTHSIQERARLYAAAFPQFPDSHFLVSDRWISATWILGNNYKSLSARSPGDEPFYGAYPPSYLKRIWPMFPDARKIIHLFSGSLTREQALPPKHPDFESRVIRIDANPDRNPDIIADAESFVDLFPGMFLDDFDLVIADPPYSIEDAENYGRPLCNKKRVLEQCYRTLRPGGILLWMDQAIPMYAKRNWKWIGTITMYRSTNHRIRGVMMFERQ